MHSYHAEIGEHTVSVITRVTSHSLYWDMSVYVRVCRVYRWL